MMQYMNTTLSVSNHQNTAPRFHRLALPKWDALIARSRHRLPELSRTVVSEVLEGHAGDALFETYRLKLLLETLVRAYAIGLFNSSEIESDRAGFENWTAESDRPPTANELQQARCSHRGLLTHCLARLYILARKSITPSVIEMFSRPGLLNEQPESLTGAEDLHQALTEAHNRVEWACLSDLVGQK
jgi:hypothetical protein